MSEQFKDQGGVATMDPSHLTRWLTSRLMTRISGPLPLQRGTGRRAGPRQSAAPHRVDYFHQVDEGYSYLAAQMLERLAARYDIELHCHLVRGQEGKNAPEPELLAQLARADSHVIASGYGLSFPHHPDAPAAGLIETATQILAAQSNLDFPKAAVSVSEALWRDNATAMAELAAVLGTASAEATTAAIEAGTQKRRELKHYSGAMFYYGGEWYWGVDRLYHLEARLADLGADTQPGSPLIAPRPSEDLAGHCDTGQYTLELYASLRSPYTAVIFDRAVAFAAAAGVTLSLPPCAAMVMRGVPATREKGYVLSSRTRPGRRARLAALWQFL
jgi:2-hydroxychromene-2-carboxylate isomerase